MRGYSPCYLHVESPTLLRIRAGKHLIHLGRNSPLGTTSCYAPCQSQAFPTCTESLFSSAALAHDAHKVVCIDTGEIMHDNDHSFLDS